MAEYLAPGVYVEEVDSGAKPIEGVSTSTAGVVGMAERGPLDIPILITSVGEYERWFGGILARDEFVDAGGRRHCYMPHAVEGFFTNLGKRLYVVRVAPAEAARAEATAHWRDPAAAIGETVLLRPAAQGTGMAPAAPLYVISDANLANGNVIRVGDGSASEYRTILSPGGITSGTTQHIPLNAVVSRAHATGGAISEHAAANVALPGVAPASTLNAAAFAGATELFVAGGDNLATFAAGPPPAADQLPWLVQLTLDGVTDLAVVTAVEIAGTTPAPASLPISRLVLNQALQRGYPVGSALTIIRSQATGARTLASDATPGDLMVFADASGAGAAIVELDRGAAGHEAFLRGSLVEVAFAQPLAVSAPAGTRIEEVALAVDGAIAAKATTAAATAGSQTLSLGNRLNLAVGQVLRIGVPNLEEFATIVALPGGGGPAPDAGTVTLALPLSRDHVSGAQVAVMVAPAFPAGGEPAARLAIDAAIGDTTAFATDGGGWTIGAFARLTTPDGAVGYVRMTAASVVVATSTVALTGNLARTHATGAVVAERQALFDVSALDVGGWGNRLSLSCENEPRGLADTHALVLTPPLQFTVESLTGLEAGSLIELVNPANDAGVLLKVRRVDRAAGAVILDPPGLTAAVLATLGAVVDPLIVRSREFRVTINLRRRPDPAVPSRNTLVLASESFPSLSMDHRHSRYFQRVIGDTNGPLRIEDNRPEGESAYVRVRDRLQGALTEPIRTGPEALVDLLPGGIVQPARHALGGGSDSLVTMSDAPYRGADNAEPRLRTGLASLRNIPEVSLVAIPGQTTAALQADIIAHCEQMRYRFAVLDAAEPDASLAGVRLQRQQFDTKYAALYYPWLTVPDPTPANLANIGVLELPASGHVLGLIARVDNERGVHKAPANEVVRGITGLTRILQKGEHDILNPSPLNINVIRDFRPDGRGIRLFGARCITSDQEHKYVNVRRLLIFLEQSIERGLQWVVFEPNAEPLWARVTQTVGNFLTDVWRGGALEGTEPSQGYFVRCDRTTMTQSDIDGGRLICVVGVAPVKPAEFVIVRIGLTTRTSETA